MSDPDYKAQDSFQEIQTRLEYFQELEAKNKELNDKVKWFNQVLSGNSKELIKENINLKNRWDKLKDIFQLTIDNYEDLHELADSVAIAKSVMELMHKLEVEGE